MSHSLLSYAALKAQVTIVRTTARFRTPRAKLFDSRFSIDNRDGRRKIHINVYRSANATKSKPSRVLLNWHGSGFVIPMHGSDDAFCHRVATETAFTVLDASYALAPEYPFPAAVEDAEDLVLWVLARPHEYDVTSVCVSGFSAGANLAIAVASDTTNKIPDGAIRALVAFYPPCDLSVDGTKKTAPDGSRSAVLPPSVVKVFDRCYMPPGVDRADPRLSVLHADFSKAPPKALFVVSGKDILCLEGEETARKMEAAGKKVTLRRAEGVDHGFDKSPKQTAVTQTETDAAYALVVEFLKTSHED